MKKNNQLTHGQAESENLIFFRFSGPAANDGKINIQQAARTLLAFKLMDLFEVVEQVA